MKRECLQGMHPRDPCKVITLGLCGSNFFFPKRWEKKEFSKRGKKMAIASSTLLSDTVLTIRDNLSTAITDPIASGRNTANRSRFVMSSYPSRPVEYPMITVRGRIGDRKRLGMQSEQMMVGLIIEIRVWARNEKEKDNLGEQVYTHIRTNNFGSGGTNALGLFDPTLLSDVLVDEPGDSATGGVKSRIFEIEFKYLTSS